MGSETLEAPAGDDHESIPEVEPIKSAVVSQGLISFPDVIALWRRWRHPKPA